MNNAMNICKCRSVDNMLQCWIHCCVLHFPQQDLSFVIGFCFLVFACLFGFGLVWFPFGRVFVRTEGQYEAMERCVGSGCMMQNSRRFNTMFFLMVIIVNVLKARCERRSTELFQRGKVLKSMFGIFWGVLG